MTAEPRTWRSGATIVPALVVLGLVLTGALMRIGSLQARGLLSPSTYGGVFAVHQVLALASVPILLLHVIPTERPNVVPRIALSLAFLAGAVLLRDGGWNTPGVYVSVAFLAVLLPLIRRPELARPHTAFHWLLRAAQLFFFVEAAALAGLVSVASVDVHLHDTLFPMAAAHFAAFVLLLEVARALSPPRPPPMSVAALLALLGGAQLFVVCCAVLGSRGMPLRYVMYIEQFEPLQIVASVGAFVASAGFLGLVPAFWRHATAPAKSPRAPNAGSR